MQAEVGGEDVCLDANGADEEAKWAPDAEILQGEDDKVDMVGCWAMRVLLMNGWHVVEHEEYRTWQVFEFLWIINSTVISK